MVELMAERPTGVTVLAIFEFIVGILAISGAMILISLISWPGALGIVGGIIPLVFGSLLWTGKKYRIVIAILILSIVACIARFVILGNFESFFAVVIGFVILYYLTRPHVKEFFGR